MALPPDLDHNRLCETALAILSLTAFTDHGATRAWKGWTGIFSMRFTSVVGFTIPGGKIKSVLITPSGTQLAEEFLKRHFGHTDQSDRD